MQQLCIGPLSAAPTACAEIGIRIKLQPSKCLTSWLALQCNIKKNNYIEILDTLGRKLASFCVLFWFVTLILKLENRERSEKVLSVECYLYSCPACVSGRNWWRLHRRAHMASRNCEIQRLHTTRTGGRWWERLQHSPPYVVIPRRDRPSHPPPPSPSHTSLTSTCSTFLPQVQIPAVGRQPILKPSCFLDFLLLLNYFI